MTERPVTASDEDGHTHPSKEPQTKRAVNVRYNRSLTAMASSAKRRRDRQGAVVLRSVQSRGDVNPADFHAVYVVHFVAALCTLPSTCVVKLSGCPGGAISNRTFMAVGLVNT